MKIFIIAMDDPLYINNMLKEIIDNRKDDIVGFAYVKNGDRMTIGKDRSKSLYLFSLLFIMGPFYFIKNLCITLVHKVRIILSNYTKYISSPLIVDYVVKYGIPQYTIDSPNNSDFLKKLASRMPNVIINQSMSILESKLLSIPTIGTLNRHNALLPKNRGRLTPFWVLYKGEPETGVSIHFVEKKIDSGDIVVQKKYKVLKRDTFNTLVKKNYAIAGKAMLEALRNLEELGDSSFFISNDDNNSSYNTIPSFSQALSYRINRLSLLKYKYFKNTTRRL